jgi:hypothetical protein
MEYGFQGYSFARKICCRKNTRKALAHKGFSNFINRLSERLGKSGRPGLQGGLWKQLHGLITFCHEVGNDGYRGSYRPKTGVRYISISTRMRSPKAVVDIDAVMMRNSRPNRTFKIIMYSVGIDI